MRFGQIRKYDIANGVGIRTTIFVTGCTHHCYNCFNEEYQDFQAGEEWTDEQTSQVIEYLQSPNVSGLTVLGGEPFQNLTGLVPLIKQIHQVCPKNIWIYSGYLWEEILDDCAKKELLELCDVLVDGLFIDELKDPALRFHGSANQRVIDIGASLRTGKVVLLWDDTNTMKPLHK